MGFVFGITGMRDGQGVHWSDMLAVDPEYRGRGIGYRLKLHQRELLLESGVDTVTWTFDPLEAGNAHLNLRRLGAVVREYRRDVYGASDSPLHAGIGTDRLLAEWLIGTARVRDRVAGPAPADGVGGPASTAGSEAPVLNPAMVAAPWPRPGQLLVEPTAPVIRITIPSDMQGLKSADLAAAVEWRKNVRAAFERAFELGYTAVDFERGERVARYVLARGFSL